jgi:hypothetical protein
MRRLLPVLLLLAALAFAAAGCGSGDDESSSEPAAAATTEGGTSGEESEEEESTPEAAVGEIAEIRPLLARAVTEVEAGKRDQAAETVGDAYLEHFEHVEHPLEERDHDLMEELEVAISTDLRKQITDGGDVSEIQASVDEINAKLDDAVEALQT